MSTFILNDLSKYARPSDRVINEVAQTIKFHNEAVGIERYYQSIEVPLMEATTLTAFEIVKCKV